MVFRMFLFVILNVRALCCDGGFYFLFCLLTYYNPHNSVDLDKLRSHLSAKDESARYLFSCIYCRLISGLLSCATTTTVLTAFLR